VVAVGASALSIAAPLIAFTATRSVTATVLASGWFSFLSSLFLTLSKKTKKLSPLHWERGKGKKETFEFVIG
jgi:hypothetical protein